MVLSMVAHVPGFVFALSLAFPGPARTVSTFSAPTAARETSLEQSKNFEEFASFFTPLEAGARGAAVDWGETRGSEDVFGGRSRSRRDASLSGDSLTEMFLKSIEAGEAVDINFDLLVVEALKAAEVGQGWLEVALNDESNVPRAPLRPHVPSLLHGVEWDHVASWLDDKNKHFKQLYGGGLAVSATEERDALLFMIQRPVLAGLAGGQLLLGLSLFVFELLVSVVFGGVIECAGALLEVAVCCSAWVVAHPWGAKWLMVLAVGVVGVNGVTCLSCHDGVPGCSGGNSCPFANLPFINSEILRSNGGSHDETTVADGATSTVTHTLLVAVTVLPRVISRFLSRGVLDFFKTVARRPIAGAVPDVESMNEQELIQAVRGGAVTPDDALNSILTRLVNAPAAQVAKLNALVSTIGQMTKLRTSSTSVGTGANGELLGIFTFAWTQAGRIVQHANAALVVAGEASAAESG